MESPSHMKNISRKSADLAKTYSEEIRQATKLANTPGAIDLHKPAETAPADLSEHARMFREFLENDGFVLSIDDLFSEDVLKQKIEKLMEDGHLKAHLPAGSTVQLAFIPFDEFGAPLEDDAIAAGQYLRLLVLKNIGTADKPQYRVEWGFSMFPNFVNRLMPKELRDLTFQIEKYDQEHPAPVSPDDGRMIIKKYSEAFNRLKNLLRKFFSN